MRAPGLLIVLALLASGPAQAQEPSQVLSVAQRQPLAFILGTPTGEMGRTSRSEIIRIVSDLLRRHTNLELEPLDANALKQCQGRLGCLTLQARDDYERSALLGPSGLPRPFREHVRAMRQAQRRYSRYLLIVSNITVAGQPDRLSAMLINTDLALTYLHEASRDAPDWQDVTEAKIESAAVVVPSTRKKVHGPREAEVFLSRLFEDAFRSPFEATGQWAPYGTVDINCPVPEAVVFLDERPLGSTQAGLTRLEKVDPGLHRLRIEHQGYKPYSTEVQVRRKQTASVQVELSANPVQVNDLPRQVTLWGGIALAAAGAGLTVYGATRPQQGLSVACIEGGATSCSGGSRFVTFGYDPEQADRDPRAINPSGVMVVPLGYSLIGTGASFTAGAALTEAGDLPWIPWVAGLVVGAAAYGISAAVAGP